MFKEKYDVIVVGAGHADQKPQPQPQTWVANPPCNNELNIAQMSCNPAMGGIAKGQLLEK